VDIENKSIFNFSSGDEEGNQMNLRFIDETKAIKNAHLSETTQPILLSEEDKHSFPFDYFKMPAYNFLIKHYNGLWDKFKAQNISREKMHEALEMLHKKNGGATRIINFGNEVMKENGLKNFSLLQLAEVFGKGTSSLCFPECFQTQEDYKKYYNLRVDIFNLIIMEENSGVQKITKKSFEKKMVSICEDDYAYEKVQALNSKNKNFFINLLWLDYSYNYQGFKKNDEISVVNLVGKKRSYKSEQPPSSKRKKTDYTELFFAKKPEIKPLSNKDIRHDINYILN